MVAESVPRPVRVRRGRARTVPTAEGPAVLADVTVGTGASLTAAAAVLQSYGQKVRPPSPVAAKGEVHAPWQHEAWALLNEIGELWFAGQWMSAALSRVRIVAAKLSDNGDEPRILSGHDDADQQDPDAAKPSPDEALVAEAVARWAGGTAGQEQLLARAGWHLGITGESYLTATAVATVPGSSEPDDTGSDLPDDASWMAWANTELRRTASGWQLADGNVDLGSNALVIRAWRPHPQRFAEAACATRAALPILRELRGLTQHVSAQIDSRLAGAGILLVPQSMTFPSGQQSADLNLADGEDPFVPILMQAMLTAIKDRDSAAAVVPIVIKVPDDSIGKMQHLTFGNTALDGQAKELRDEAVNRLSLALDIPKEIISGRTGAGVNHWTSWQIEESAIKLHVAPHASVLCHALTVGWLQPLLAALEVKDPDSYLVWFDTTPLVLRPDRSADAKELYDRAAIGAEALRRETGFADTDAPSAAERQALVLIRIVERAPTLAPLVLPLLGIGIDNAELAQAAATMLALAGQAPNAPGAEGPRGVGGNAKLTPEQAGQTTAGMLRDARTLTPTEAKAVIAKAGPGQPRTLPDRSQSVAASLGDSASPCPDPVTVEACHLAVLRALEYAGKRMVFGSRKQQSEYRAMQTQHPYRLHTLLPVMERDLDHLLDGAWACLKEGRTDHLELQPLLDRYVRLLLLTSTEHTRTLLTDQLTTHFCEDS